MAQWTASRHRSVVPLTSKPSTMFSFTRLPFAFPTFSFPSISLPAAIQSRFVAFVLQKSIGHLVKPGQLDSNQINAQIGSGYVEIKDVEVNEDVRT